MSRPIDEKLVKMKMDNSDFQAKVSDTIGMFGKLQSAFSGLKPVNVNSTVTGLSDVASSVSSIESRFSALGVVAMTVLQNITNKAMAMGDSLIKATMIEPLTTGFQEYELKMGSIQTILANTARYGTGLDEVTASLDELNQYADKTIYNFGDMTRNIGMFTNSGLRVEEATSMIKGFSNEAAASGTNAQGAASAAYQLSQALSAGTVRLMDWRSLTNVGMGNKNMQTGLIEIADAMGVLNETGTTAEEIQNDFNSSLEKNWLSADVMSKYLRIMAGETTDAEMASMGLTEAQIAMFRQQATTAEEAATKVRTFTQLIGTTKEAIGSGWAETWGLMFGDFNEATEMWTAANNAISEGISSSAEARNKLVTDFIDLGGRTTIINAIVQGFDALSKIFQAMKGGFEAVFPPATGQTLMNLAIAIESFAKGLMISDEAAGKVKTTFQGLFSILSIGIEVFNVVKDKIKDMIPDDAGTSVLDFIAKIAELIIQFDAGLKAGNGFKDGITAIGDVIGGAVQFVWNLAQSLSDFFIGMATGAIELANKLGPTVDKVVGFFKKLFESIDLNDALNVGFIGALIAGIKKFGDLTDSVGDFVGGFTGVLGSFKEGVANLGGISDVLQNMSTNIKVDSLLKIAVAVGILAVSIMLISGIDAQDVAKSLEVIALVLIGLTKTLDVIGKLDFTGSGAFKSVALLLALGGAVVLLAAGLKILSTIDPEQLGNGTIVLIAIVGSLVLAMKGLSSIDSKMLVSSGTLIAVAASVVILAAAVKILSGIEPGDLAKGVAALGIILLELGIFLKIANGNKLNMGSAAALVITTGAVVIMVNQIQELGNIPVDQLKQGLVALTIILAELAIFVKVTNGAKLMSAAVGLLLVAGAINALVGPIKTLGSTKPEELATGLTVLGLALLGIVGAMHLAKGGMGGAVSILIMAEAISVLVPPLVTLSGLSIKEIAIALGTLAVAFGVIGLAGMILGPAAPGIIAFSIAVAAIGAALALAGIGFAAAVTGMIALSAMGTASIAALLGSLGLLLFGLKGLIPAIVDFAVTLVVELAQGLAKGGPKIIDSALTLMLGFLEALNENVPKIIEVGLQLVTNLANSLADNLPPLIEAGANLIIELLNGMANTIRENDEKLADAMKNIIEAMLEALITGLVEILNVLLGWIPGFEAMTGDLGGKAKEALREAFDVKPVGEERGQDFVDGVGSKTGASRSIGTKVGQAGKDGAASVDWTSTGGKHAEQLATGTTGGATRSFNAGSHVGQQGRSGASSVSFYQTGSNYAIGLAQGMVESANYSWNAGAYIGTEAARATRNSLQVKSPSRVAKKIGNFYGEGLGIGIREMGSYVGEQAATMAQKAVDTARSYATAFAEVMDENMNLQPVISPVMDLSNVSGFAMNGTMRVNGINGTTSNAASGIRSIVSVGQGNQNGSDGTVERGLMSTINNLIDKVEKMSNAPIIVELDVDGKRITRELANPMRKEFERYDVNQAIITKGRR